MTPASDRRYPCRRGVTVAGPLPDRCCRRPAWFLLCLLGLPGVAWGQGAGDGADVREGGAVSRERLDTISITATRNPIKAFEYPGMVTVTGAETIRAGQPSTPDDVLKLVPNVEFTGGPRRTGEVPSIRGFDGPDVIILLDGARQNFGSQHDGRFFLDPSLLQQVEVLRGPASSLYGSGGTGGVIEFRTINARDRLAAGERVGLSLSTGYQVVNDELASTVTGYGVAAERLDWVASLTKRDAGTIRLGDGNELRDSDDDIRAGLAKAGLTWAEHHRLQASWIGYDNDAVEPNNGQQGRMQPMAGPPPPGGRPTLDINQFELGRVEKNTRSDTFRLAYGYHDPDNRLLDLDVVAYRSQFEADELRLDSLGFGPAGELLRRDVDTTGVRIDNRSRPLPSASVATTLTYGVELYRDEQDGAAAAGARSGVPDAETDFQGVFAQAEFAVAGPRGEDILLLAGARYDRYRSRSSIGADNEEDAFSPRLGVSYLPNDWLMLFSNYAHAFRAPTYNELYLAEEHFRISAAALNPFLTMRPGAMPLPPEANLINRFIPNPDLRPQRTRTAEFGGGLGFEDVLLTGDSVQLKASYFRVWGSDFIDLNILLPFSAAGRTAAMAACRPPTPDSLLVGCTTVTNVAEARLDGVEVEATYEHPRFLVALGYSTVDGEDRAGGDKLGLLTPAQVTVNTGLKLPGMAATVGWRAILAAEFDKVDDAVDRRAGYAVHDFYFSWSPRHALLRGLRLDLGLDNAFDKAYQRVAVGAVEAGRNFKARLAYSIAW